MHVVGICGPSGVGKTTLIEGLIERNPGEEMGWFWSIRPMYYPVPNDGPVGDMLRASGFERVQSLATRQPLPRLVRARRPP